MVVTTLKLTSREPNRSVIRALRRCLDRANAGKIDGIIILGIEGNGDHLRVTAGTMAEADATHLLELQKHATLQAELATAPITDPDEVGADVDPDDDGEEGSE